MAEGKSSRAKVARHPWTMMTRMIGMHGLGRHAATTNDRPFRVICRSSDQVMTQPSHAKQQLPPSWVARDFALTFVRSLYFSDGTLQDVENFKFVLIGVDEIEL
jgi:hypothetical protein